MKIRIGTRKSALALAQASLLQDALSSGSVDCELVGVQTTGDTKQNLQGPVARDKKEWVMELEHALLNFEIDVAIHSAKDVPVEIHSGTAISSVFLRELPHDVFIGHQVSSIDELPTGAVVGTASLRRKAQVQNYRSDLKVVELRGNVPTRIEKVQAGLVDGIILAAAGCNRLKLTQVHGDLDLQRFLPAMNQGILAVQFRKEDQSIHSLVSPLVDSETQVAFLAERECVRILEADCRSALSVFASVSGRRLKLQAQVFDLSSRTILTAEQSGEIDQAEMLGRQVGNELLAKGARELLKQS